MTEQASHTLHIELKQRYAHGQADACSVSVDGEGDEDHFITAFQAILVAAGWSIEKAATLGFEK